MIAFKQHIPAFVDGQEPVETVVESQDELLALPCVSAWRAEGNRFHRFSLADDRYLMAELNGGQEFWVVGYILGGRDRLSLPTWVKP